MKLLVWDFDGTLAYRDGMWTGTLCEILEAHAPHLLVRREALRAELQTGFPWHTPDQSHLHLATTDQWWDAVRPVFSRAFLAIGASQKQASTLALLVRSQYCNITRKFPYGILYQGQSSVRVLIQTAV